MLSKKTTLYYFGFFLISILALWQIVFFVHPVKYDMIDCYFPWRFFIGECFHSGNFPYWNPYQDLGYPIHADPSSGVWYPFVWLFGSTIGYNIYTIGIEYWIHVFIAAIGFFKLCKTLKLNDESSVIAALCYMLCGVFIGNAQHLTYVVSACWIPFILNFYFQLSEKGGFFNAIKTAFFISLLLTGGYPAFTITLFYLLMILFIFFSIQFLFIQKNRTRFIKFVLENFLILIFVLLMAGGILLSVYEVTPFLNRTNNFNIDRALFCPFSPQSMISFVFPFASINNMEFYDTDLSMSNAYFGIVAFIFFFVGLFMKKPVQFKILFGFGIFALLASFGKYLPVRTFLFDHVPLMNLFRFPSTFRLFAIIAFLLVSGFAIHDFFEAGFETIRKKVKSVLFILLPALLITIVVCRLNGYISIFDFIKNDLFIFSKNSRLTQHITLNAIIQMALLGLLLFVILKVNEKRNLFLYFLLIVCSDMIISAQLNAPYTVIYQEFSSKESNDHLKKFPKGFPMIQKKSISETDPHEMYFGPFWKNVNIFQKQISSEGFNSFALTDHEYFRDETPQLYNATIKNKVVFLSDEIYDESVFEKMNRDSSLTSKSLFLNSTDLSLLKTNTFKSDSSDKINLQEFSPNVFVAQTQTKNTQLLTLIQSNYKGWKAYVNDIPTPILTSNRSLISLVLPAGNNMVKFEYSVPKIKFAFIVSVISILFALFAIGFEKRILNLWQQRKK